MVFKYKIDRTFLQFVYRMSSRFSWVKSDSPLRTTHTHKKILIKMFHLFLQIKWTKKIEFRIFYLFYISAGKRDKMQGFAYWQILRFRKCQLPAGGRWLLPHTGAYSNPVFFSVFPQIIFYSSFLFYTWDFTSALLR